MAGRCSCIRTRENMWVSQNDKVRMTARMPLKPTYQTHKEIDKTHTKPYMPLPPSAYPGNPFPSRSLSGKSMNTEGHLRRQVRISLIKPHNAIKPTISQSAQGRLACAYTPLISVKSQISSESMLHLATFNIVIVLIKPGNNDSFNCRLICCHLSQLINQFFVYKMSEKGEKCHSVIKSPR